MVRPRPPPPLHFAVVLSFVIIHPLLLAAGRPFPHNPLVPQTKGDDELSGWVKSGVHLSTVIKGGGGRGGGGGGGGGRGGRGGRSGRGGGWWFVGGSRRNDAVVNGGRPNGHLAAFGVVFLAFVLIF